MVFQFKQQTELKQQSLPTPKTLFKQQAEIKELTETVQKLAIALEKQGMSLQSQGQKLDGVKSDVDEIKSKPGKRWDTVIAAVISALVGFFLARLGLIK